MKKLMYITAALVLAAGCAREAADNTPQLEKQAFDAWIEMNKGEGWTKTPLGCWIAESTPGDPAKPVGTKNDHPFVRLHFTTRSLSGKVQATTDETLSLQLGQWNSMSWYGPIVTNRSVSIYAGLEEVLSTMHVGGRCKFVVPGWLQTNKTYSTGEEYNLNVTGNQSVIYDLTVVDAFDTVLVWEQKQIEEFVGGPSEMAKLDTLEEGVYYKCITASTHPDSTFNDGDKLYVNYVCRRLLDNKAVDSNIKDTCKVIGTYSPGRSYEPILVNYASDYTEMTMTESESKMISGFARAIYSMKPYEKGIVYMTSQYGYQDSGQGSDIPAFCPLVFELELTDAPE